MAEEWTSEDEAEFKRLNNKRMRIYRDKNRKIPYMPRKSTNRNSKSKEGSK